MTAAAMRSRSAAASGAVATPPKAGLLRRAARKASAFWMHSIVFS